MIILKSAAFALRGLLFSYRIYDGLPSPEIRLSISVCAEYPGKSLNRNFKTRPEQVSKKRCRNTLKSQAVSQQIAGVSA